MSDFSRYEHSHPEIVSPRRVVSQDYFTPVPTVHRRYRTAAASTSPRQNHSDVVYGEDVEGLSIDSSEDGTSGSDTDLDISSYDVPVTGFAVASNKRNADFHELFPLVPETDYLIDDYGCALQKDILLHGRIYISENHVCFHANIFSWITNFIIPFDEITALEKKMTAFVIPNAILISTLTAKYTFASLLARDLTYDILFNIWRLARPDSDSSSLDTPLAVLNEQQTPMAVNSSPLVQHKQTNCACSRNGQHFSESIADAIFPGTPDRIHNLLFASGFIKDFMRTSQNLLDIQISDWMPTETGSKLLARNMSYIKPLSGVVGPKQAKCEIRDETIFMDFDKYTSMLTSTRTPEVPSGGVFTVRTRTCVTWASLVTTRVVITSQVEWTGRSFIKGIIERSSIEGQISYQRELDKAMRQYIHDHRAEFVPVGMNPAVLDAVEASSTSAAVSVTQPILANAPSTPQERNGLRLLQWAWETCSGTYSVARKSTFGALELLRDLRGWDSSVLYFVILVLAFSNIYTIRLGSDTANGENLRTKALHEDSWMQAELATVWSQLLQNARQISETQKHNTSSRMRWKEEVGEINSMLDTIEERVKSLGERLVVAAVD